MAEIDFVLRGIDGIDGAGGMGVAAAVANRQNCRGGRVLPAACHGYAGGWHSGGRAEIDGGPGGHASRSWWCGGAGRQRKQERTGNCQRFMDGHGGLLPDNRPAPKYEAMSFGFR